MSNQASGREVPPVEEQAFSRTPDRRTVLRTAGLVALSGGAAAGLAACASGTTTPAATTAPSSAAPSSAAPSSAAPTSAAPSSAAPSESASSAAAPKGPSVTAANVPVGSGVILEEPNDYVVTQPTKGEYKAFTAICTHQQCRVTEVRDDTIVCACHQSQFSIKDGSVVQDPAPEPLAEFQVTVSGGKVYVEE